MTKLAYPAVDFRSSTASTTIPSVARSATSYSCISPHAVISSQVGAAGAGRCTPAGVHPDELVVGDLGREQVRVMGGHGGRELAAAVTGCAVRPSWQATTLPVRAAC
jgi:hypothetical protein